MTARFNAPEMKVAWPHDPLENRGFSSKSTRPMAAHENQIELVKKSIVEHCSGTQQCRIAGFCAGTGSDENTVTSPRATVWSGFRLSSWSFALNEFADARARRINQKGGSSRIRLQSGSPASLFRYRRARQRTACACSPFATGNLVNWLLSTRAREFPGCRSTHQWLPDGSSPVLFATQMTLSAGDH